MGNPTCWPCKTWNRTACSLTWLQTLWRSCLNGTKWPGTLPRERWANSTTGNKRSVSLAAQSSAGWQKFKSYSMKTVYEKIIKQNYWLPSNIFCQFDLCIYNQNYCESSASPANCHRNKKQGTLITWNYSEWQETCEVPKRDMQKYKDAQIIIKK